MKRCPNCKTEILFDNTEFCEHCGVTLKPTPKEDDALEFTVSEAHDSKDDDAETYTARPAKDTLGVQSSAEWLEGQKEDEPITQPVPVAPVAKPAQADVSDTQKVRKLSEKELESIEKKLYSKEKYLSEADKQAALRKIEGDTAPRAHLAPVLQPADLHKPAAAKRGRGLAYFMKNYIQIHGDVELHENDEIIVNDRPYLLRKKRLDTKTYGIVAGAAFLVLLAIFVPMLVRDTHNGQGEIVGVALDENHQPFIEGATIRLPESGKSATANGEGFFRVKGLNPGTHRVEYVVNGQTIKVDYATVTAGDLTTMTLFPGELASVEDLPSVGPDQPQNYDQAYDDSRPAAVPHKEDLQRPIQPGSTSKKSDFGKIALAANVDGARLTIDGTVIGAGNLTFNRISSGQRSYTVSKEGYQTASGTVNVPSDAIVTLEVALKPAENVAVISLEGQYNQAVGTLRSGNVDGAIASLSSILETHPNYTAAYLSRAEAYTLASRRTDAHDDYLRAAEIFRINGEYGHSMTAFNNAVKMMPNSVPALLGRAGLHMARQEEIAAIADYEAILKVDKRSARAHFGLGEARFAQGNYKQAIKHLKDARSEDPNDPVIYQYLMLCYFGDDDLKNVKKSYDKFKETATQEQLSRLEQDRAYSAVLRVVQNEQ